MNNILIVFYYYQYPMRATIRDHLYSFRKYSAHRCFYLNLAVREVPWYVRKIPFDLIIFHTIFLSSRWSLKLFDAAVDKARSLKSMRAVKIALPQDEFLNTKVLCDFINEFEIDHVFSVAPPSEWKKIYPNVNFEQVHFHHVLTGYLDEETIAKVKGMEQSFKNRPIDIGYRAWRAEPWLGRHGILKTQIADLFVERTGHRGLKIDISTHHEDTILGDDWYRFLMNCKYTIGVEGGASLLDFEGKIREATNAFLAQHPLASFEEVREACFKLLDHSLRLFAISPRHLEACLTKTCQILVEGEYNGILFPNQHYIELKRNFDNLEEVLEVIETDQVREEIVERAYQDIVESGTYTYRSFVRSILERSLGHLESSPSPSMPSVWEFVSYWWMKGGEAFSWTRIALHLKLYGEIRKRVPSPLIGMIRKIRWGNRSKP
jgi:hypothetical protein